jgi:hypothetical protein
MEREVDRGKIYDEKKILPSVAVSGGLPPSARPLPRRLPGNADVHADGLHPGAANPDGADAKWYWANDASAADELRQPRNLVAGCNQGGLELLVLRLEILDAGLQLLQPGFLPLATLEGGCTVAMRKSATQLE